MFVEGEGIILRAISKYKTFTLFYIRHFVQPIR